MTDHASGAGTDAAATIDHSEGMTLDSILEAVLITLDRPTPAGKLAEALTAGGQDDFDADAIEAAADRLNEQYDQTGRSFRIERVGGGLRLMTLPAYAPAIACVRKSRESSRLSRPALETLAIVAYRQPVTRAELEAIRGVACGEVLRSLLDRKLLMIKGRAEELGRPMLYGTTKHFLDQFGLASLKDLPANTEFDKAGEKSPRDGAQAKGGNTPEPASEPETEPAPESSGGTPEPEPKPVRTGLAHEEG